MKCCSVWGRQSRLLRSPSAHRGSGRVPGSKPHPQHPTLAAVFRRQQLSGLCTRRCANGSLPVVPAQPSHHPPKDTPLNPRPLKGGSMAQVTSQGHPASSGGPGAWVYVLSTPHSPHLVCVLLDLLVKTLQCPPNISLKFHFHLLTARAKRIPE